MLVDNLNMLQYCWVAGYRREQQKYIFSAQKFYGKTLIMQRGLHCLELNYVYAWQRNIRSSQSAMLFVLFAAVHLEELKFGRWKFPLRKLIFV